MKNFDKAYKNLIFSIDNLKISEKNKIELFHKVDKFFEIFIDQIVINENLDARLSTLENIVLEDENDSNNKDVDFKCPYCHKNITIFMHDNKMDIECPYCKNEIELEWKIDN